MRRRDFLGIVGGAAAWPAVATSQQAVPVVGFLNGTSPQGYGHFAEAFRQGLRDAGFVEGQNVTIDYRWAGGDYERLKALADDLVQRRVAVIAATSTPANLVAKNATSSIPIIFTTSSDPVALGLVASLNRPGSNVTGITNLNIEVGSKRFELLHQFAPSAKTIGVIGNGSNPNIDAQRKNVEAAARAFGLKVKEMDARTEGDLDLAAAHLAQEGTRLCIVNTDAFLFSRRDQLALLAKRHALSMMFDRREYVEAGGLMSYGGSVTNAYYLAGGYAGRILKGEKPGNLPVIQATKVEFVINLKSAKEIGVTFTPALLALANEVIE